MIDQECGLLVLIRVTNYDIQVFVELHLVRRVIAYISDKEPIARRDQLDILRVVDRDAIDALLDYV